MTTSPPLDDGNSINVVKERQRMTREESATIVDERSIWPEIGSILREERSVRSVEGMDILLCVAVVRGTVMWLGEERVSNKGILVDDHVT